MCKKIHRGGGAEQYHPDKKYKEAVAVAVEVCADDDPGATLEDIREAVTTLEETERTARRVLGGQHPLTTEIEKSLQNSRAVLRAHETPGAA